MVVRWVTHLCEKGIAYDLGRKDIWWPKNPEMVVQTSQGRIRHKAGKAVADAAGIGSYHLVSVVLRDRSGPMRLATVIVGKVPEPDWKGWDLRPP